MKPTRSTQPYRQGAREPGPALDAMLRGRDSQGHNPKDLERAMVREQGTQERTAGRELRKPREARKPRTPRSG